MNGRRALRQPASRPDLPGRRRSLAWIAGLAAPAAAASTASEPPLGWVRPGAAPPALKLVDAQGRERPLAALLEARCTAVQLIFTGCGATCPTQGLLFSQLAHRTQVADAGWLSITIDPLSDDAAALRRWQERFGAHARWRAATPALRDVEALAGYLRGVPSRQGAHTAQVFVFDSAARLVYRTGDNPQPHFVDALVAHVARQGHLGAPAGRG